MKKWVVVQTQAPSLSSIFTKGLTLLILCQPGLTNVIHHLPLSHLSLLCISQDRKELTRNVRSEWNNTQCWLGSIQLPILYKRVAEKCTAFIHLLLTFHGQGSCSRQWILSSFCAGDLFAQHIGGQEGIGSKLKYFQSGNYRGKYCCNFLDGMWPTYPTSLTQYNLRGTKQRVEWRLQRDSVKTLVQEGTQWYFLVDKPHKSWKPREIRKKTCC